MIQQTIFRARFWHPCMLCCYTDVDVCLSCDTTRRIIPPTKHGHVARTTGIKVQVLVTVTTQKALYIILYLYAVLVLQECRYEYIYCGIYVGWRRAIRSLENCPTRTMIVIPTSQSQKNTSMQDTGGTNTGTYNTVVLSSTRMLYTGVLLQVHW